MGKISVEAKKRYFEKVKEYKQLIDKMTQREKNILELIQKGDPAAEYKKLTLADENLNLASYFILLNDVSVELLGVKNEGFLNDARKCCYKTVIYLEDVVSDFIDVPFSDYKDKLEKIDGFQDENRFNLARKLGFTIQSVVDGFGDNSKWKWSFVELEGRLATVAKNLLNLKTLTAGLDPRVEGYEARLGHLNLVKDLLNKSADRYREKYELSTLRIDDFKKAISYLQSLKRLHSLLADINSVEMIRKKVEVWSAKMDSDERRVEEKKSS
jgi:hypothetical protein